MHTAVVHIGSTTTQDILSNSVQIDASLGTVAKSSLTTEHTAIFTLVIAIIQSIANTMSSNQWLTIVTKFSSTQDIQDPTHSKVLLMSNKLASRTQCLELDRDIAETVIYLEVDTLQQIVRTDVEQTEIATTLPCTTIEATIIADIILTTAEVGVLTLTITTIR
jgi:hypothetical protein